MKKILLEPLKVIQTDKAIFWLWLIFAVFAGQIGILANIILRKIYSGYDIGESIYIDSINGNFYTYAIALVASILGPLFVNFIETSPTKFKIIKIFLIIFSVFTLFFVGIFYSSYTLKTFHPENLKELKLSIDWSQFIFFILTIALAIYVFCIIRMDSNYEKFKHLDTPFSQKDDEKVDELADKVVEVKIDKFGNKLG